MSFVDDDKIRALKGEVIAPLVSLYEVEADHAVCRSEPHYTTMLFEPVVGIVFRTPLEPR